MSPVLPSTRCVILATFAVCTAAIVAGRAGHSDMAQAMIPLCALGFWLVGLVALREAFRWKSASLAGQAFRCLWILAAVYLVVVQPLRYLWIYLAE